MTVNDRGLSDVVTALTERIRRGLLMARRTGRQYGHEHVGTEHVFLAILVDPRSIPSQMMSELDMRDKVIGQIQALLTSTSYNRPLGRPNEE